jgi:5'-nucleotidase
MKTILLTNDDGISSPGLTALLRAVENVARCTVVAPDRDNSAVSHSLTMNRPLRVVKQSEESYSVDGTPADCVALGLKKILPNPPDLLISGINNGPNLGNDIFYSGTVSAAIEGTMYGIPSIAVSVGGRQPLNYDAAARIAALLAGRILENNLPENILLNVNVPSGSNPGSIRITRQGTRLWKDAVHETFDPWGVRHYWIGGGTAVIDNREGTDVHCFAGGNVSITPIQLDRTSYPTVDMLEKKWHLQDLLSE